jgi:Kef-type K+ transport system membrane component KefB
MEQILGVGSRNNSWRLAVGYAAMLAIAGGLFWLITLYGQSLPLPAVEVPARTPAAKPTEILPRVLLALVAVIGTGRLLGALLAKFGQPPVIGEVMAGILLGPSLLGREASGWLLPPSAAPYLGVLAQLGVILYMFVVGLELNAQRLRHQAHAAVAISHASIVFPFLLGAVLAAGLYTSHAPGGVPFTSFALFFGISMSVTAFPVLARILSDRGMSSTKLGALALACAAADDVTAWCLLAFVVGVVNASVGGAALTALFSLAYIAFMFFVARPAVALLLSSQRTVAEPRPTVVTGILLAALVSALITEEIGIHAVFGAFLLGAILPRDAPVSRVFVEKLGPMAATLLLPAFFAYTGLRTEIGLVSGFADWMTCGLIIVVATVGKFGGTYAAAKFAGLDARAAAGLGVLMNTRGLMELVVLNIGLDLGVITPKLFAMLVLMAIVTTVATTPALRRIYSPEAEAAGSM